ncbi:MAG: DUF4129 domain-containing protein, partial [Chloroflexota bacterium]|nr:DUF4129 domain-containing protein [Chloroflexota bacterium]
GQARSAPAGARQPLVDRARELLLRTDAVRTEAGSTLRVDDAPLAERISAGDAQLTQAIGHLDASIAFAGRDASDTIDPAVADGRLRDVLGAHESTTAPSLGALLQRAIDNVVTRVVVGLRELGIDPEAIGRIAIAGLALAIVLVLAAIFGPALRERVRPESVLPPDTASRSSDPKDHLREADAARGARHNRDALHQLYLYALTSLAAGEAIRYDPALTDHELLLRAAAIPQVGALRELVALHERAWFGLREPSGDDADRARALALKVTA